MIGLSGGCSFASSGFWIVTKPHHGPFLFALAVSFWLLAPTTLERGRSGKRHRGNSFLMRKEEPLKCFRQTVCHRFFVSKEQ